MIHDEPVVCAPRILYETNRQKPDRVNRERPVPTPDNLAPRM